MHVTLVHIHVKPESVDDFIAACRDNHEHSVKEPGNRRFDVLQDAAAHKGTAHYSRWRDSVAEMMAEPRTGVGYRGLLPEA